MVTCLIKPGSSSSPQYEKHMYLAESKAAHNETTEYPETLRHQAWRLYCIYVEFMSPCKMLGLYLTKQLLTTHENPMIGQPRHMWNARSSQIFPQICAMTMQTWGGGSNVSMIICVRVNCLLRKLIKMKTLGIALKASDWFEIGFNHANARFEERAICF